MTKYHFEIHFTDSSISEDFNGKCNRVNYADDNYLVCENVDGYTNTTTLAMYPHHRIKSIKRKEN